MYPLDLEPLRFLLYTIEDQEALYLDFAKAMSAQQLPATMNRELGYNYDAHRVCPVASSLSATTADEPLGTTSRPISILFSSELLGAEDETCDWGLRTETVGGGSLPASRISARGTLTCAASADA
jgi:hypothetical protein